MSCVSECLPVDHGGPVDRPFEPFPYSALDGSIIDRFEAVALRFPARLAVEDATRSFTYANLAGLVDRVSIATAAATENRLGPVALILPNDARYPAAMLGVLAAGRGYIPLNADHSIERNRLIVTQAAAAAVISAGDLAKRLRARFPHDLKVVDIEMMDVSPRRSRLRPGPDDLAHIIYTSGSTGTPKGVYHNHRSCLHEVLQTTNRLHLTHEDRSALFYSPSAIGGSKNVFAALLNGASLHILPARDLGPAGLVQEIRSRGITVYRALPSLFRHVIDALGPNQRLDSLRVVSLAGDPVDWGHISAFRRGCSPEMSLGIGIASTECPSCYLYWFVDDRFRGTSLQLPVGWAVPDETVMIVDKDGRPAADGEVGEFVVASRYLALGYWRDPGATASAFTIDPADPEIRIFKTGDLGRRRPDGLYEFCGRKDHQIKISGHRIEPAEIESALRTCAGVGDAAVLVRKNSTGAPRSLAAYVEVRRGVLDPQSCDLTSTLTERLPGYMVPPTIILIDELPRLSNLKIDHVRLAQMDAAGTVQFRLDPIDDPLVEEVTRIFELVIGTVGAAPTDNVASLGGDSLQAVNVALELENHFGVVIPPQIFKATQTIGALARWIASRKEQRPSRSKLD